MNDPNTIIRVAARGDGVTADGRHIAGAAPGDVALDGGTLQHGPHHAEPPCRHFGTCGGCELQHLDDHALAQFITERVSNAAEGQGIAIGELLATHISPAHTRRRATLHALASRGNCTIGFKQRGSHKLIDLRECPILRPELIQLIAPLRKFIGQQSGQGNAKKVRKRSGPKRSEKPQMVDIGLSLSDQEIDCSLSHLALDGLRGTESALEFAQANGLARLSIDQGYGPETLFEPEPVTQTLSHVPVSFPSGAFLQATADAERQMLADASDWIGDAGTIADLFSGLGTFAFALAGQKTRATGSQIKVLAAEAARDAYLACQAAANARQLPVHALHRDLFRNPLQPDELSRFEAVLLDPPRAGARDQIEQITNSSVGRVVYVSCNPSSWAKDAKKLVESGFSLEKLRPVGQFRWSTHVELTSYFTRDG